MNHRTKVVKFKVTPSEYETLMSKSKRFSSTSAMLRQAIECFDTTTSADRLNRIHALAKCFKEFDRQLAAVGNNLNQAVKTMNEMNITNNVTDFVISDIVYPEVRKTLDILVAIRGQISRLTKSAIHESL